MNLLMDQDQVHAFYDANIEQYEKLKGYLYNILQTELYGLKGLNIQKRLKSKTSFYKKCTKMEGDASKYYSPTDVKDFLGLRIIVPFSNNLEYAVEALFRITEDNNLEVLSSGHSYNEDLNHFSYRSWHVEISISDGCSERFEEYKGMSFEIQVRTIAMHAWAILSHESLYKGQAKLSNDSIRSLGRASALLEEVDMIFDGIIAEMAEHAPKE